MMDTTQDVHDVLKNVKLVAKENEELIRRQVKSRQSYDSKINNQLDDIIDVDSIDFSNDEVWLYETPDTHSNIKDLKTWLHQDSSIFKEINYHTQQLSLIREISKKDTKKSIDSRTFTRPKKRLNRPSIEMYNENYFKTDRILNSSTGRIGDPENENFSSMKLGKCDDNVADITRMKNSLTEGSTLNESCAAPLNFDLTQPASIFDNMSGSVPDLDNFQPPSLVNSMCSSTFANLMENSVIKNDPELREIRDADYTEADLHLPKSFTDSYSSISSDTPEGFLKQAVDTINKSWQNNKSKNEESFFDKTSAGDTTVLDCTYRKSSSSDTSSSDLCLNGNSTIIASQPSQTMTKDLNSTFTNTSPTILNGTFRKSNKTALNSTFQKNASLEDHNETITIADSVNFDNHRLMKRRSYILDNRDTDSNHSNSKRNSIGCSAGSTDSLDYMSSLSTSSRGSNKMLNMAEIDAIVQQQERSLHVMSTPKPSNRTIHQLWENNGISPISVTNKGDRLSDSESSNDEYLTVDSSSSNVTTVYDSDTHIPEKKRSSSATDVPKMNPKSLNSIPTRMAGSNNKMDTNFKGSYSNLKTVDRQLKGSYTNLKPRGANIKSSYSNLAGGNIKGSYSNLAGGNIKGSYSNLKTMSNNLKGSYTQLKPVLSNLPDTNMRVPNSYNTITKQPTSYNNIKKNSDGNLRIAEVAPTLRDISKDIAKSTSALNFTRAQTKTSGLPRPVSGIPRPSAAVSRIPGPRTASVRPISLRQPNRPLSKVNFDGDF